MVEVVTIMTEVTVVVVVQVEATMIVIDMEEEEEEVVVDGKEVVCELVDFSSNVFMVCVLPTGIFN